MLEPLLGVWKTDLNRDDRGRVLRILAKLKDPRSLDVAVEGLEEMLMEAPALMRAVGTHKEVPRVIEIYKNALPPSMESGGVLDLIGDLGGPKALRNETRIFYFLPIPAEALRGVPDSRAACRELGGGPTKSAP